MSALTDLFTALANKIRSKTGGSDTYTPPEMVAAIDDVYDAGVAAGTTPTQTKTVTAGTSATTVTPDQGYALSSVTVNPTPSQTKSAGPNVSTNKDVTPDSGYLLSKVTITPLSHTGTYTPAVDTAANDMGQYHDKRYVNTSGMIIPSGDKSITANGSGIDVKAYSTVSVNVPSPTINSITPSNSSPAAMSSGNNYSPTAAGYAISSYSSVTPSSSGASFSSGMVKMNGNGYAYSSRPTPTPSETELWTNSAPTSDFSSGTQTVSNMSSYDYIKVYFKPTKSSSAVYSTIFDRVELVSTHSGSNYVIGCTTSSSIVRARRFRANSATQVNFTACYRVDGTAEGSQTGSVIPTKITGIKYS